MDYMKWRNLPKHIWVRRLMNGLSLVFTWKSYKLSYSGFYGFKLRPAVFSQPKVFRDLLRKGTYYHIAFVYAPMIILNLVGLIDLDWGTQLYIMMIENIIIAIIMISVGLWENKKCDTHYLSDDMNRQNKRQFNVMSALEDDSLPEFSKTKEHLLAETDKNNSIFLTHKFDELINDFGGRLCKSFNGFELTENERV